MTHPDTLTHPASISLLAKNDKRVTIYSQAEMAELADALGSGPSPVQTGWRFESSFRQFVNVRNSPQ